MFVRLLCYSCVFVIFIYAGNSTVIVCDTNDDCRAVDADCVGHLCTCNPGKILSYDGSRCLELTPLYNGTCEEDTQCALLTGKYFCSTDGHCRCETGYKYAKGRCVRRVHVGEPCSEDVECFNGMDYSAAVCKAVEVPEETLDKSPGLIGMLRNRKAEENKVCTCTEGYYSRGNYDCRPLRKNLGETCALDADCLGIEGIEAYCALGECADRQDARHRQVNMDEEFESFNYDWMYQPILNLQGNNSIIKLAISDDCIEDVECPTNANCHRLFNKCTCNHGYFPQAMGCAPELGSTCTQNLDCNVLFSECINNLCVCSGSYATVYSDGNQYCMKSTTSPAFACTARESCGLFGENYYCNFDKEEFKKTCACEIGFEFDTELFLCVGNALECNSDYTCGQERKNSVCENFKCVCNKGYVDVNNVCLPLIGGVCEDDFPCTQVEQSRCDTQTQLCKCMDGYVPSGISECVKVVDELLDECIIDAQCSAKLPNSLCVKGVCRCAEYYQEHEGACYDDNLYGKYCESSLSCRTPISDEFDCIKSKCTCPKDYGVSVDKRKCVYTGGAHALSAGITTIALSLLFSIRL